MKWRPIASDVINRLQSLSLIDSKRLSELNGLINSGKPIKAFTVLRRWMAETDWAVGWNKIICKGVIYGWYGHLVTVHPLRLAAVEIESNPVQWEICRQILIDLWQKRKTVSYKKEDVEAIRLLQELGVNPHCGKLDGQGIELMHRLNLDRREMPVIERWRWSGSTGQAFFSDGGRHQVSRDTVWLRSIEAGINSDGNLDPEMRDFLDAIDQSQLETLLPDNRHYSMGSKLWKCLTRLELYRLAKRETDRVLFSIKIGEIAATALKLWE